LLPVGSYTYMGWFGNGLWRLNNNTLQASPVRHFANDDGVAIMFKCGQNLVVQTLNNTCYITDVDLRVKSAMQLQKNFSLTVVKDKIYAVGQSGLVNLLDDNLKTARQNLFPEITSRITEITTYRDNYLISTFGQGLFLYNGLGKLVRRLHKKNGLTTNIITSLLVEGDKLYIGSNLGLIEVGLPELQSVKTFKESEGMFNWECRTNGLKKLPNGAIFIATTNGPYVYHPSRDPAREYASGVLSLADIRYGENGEKGAAFSPYDRQIVLPDAIAYNEKNLTVTLKGISQRAPNDIMDHYQLGGYDSMWVTTADPVIAFTALPPGTYKLKAYLSVGTQHSKPLTMAFSIAKPLSGELWFQLLLVLCLSGVCWALLTMGNRIYQKYIQTKMVVKLEADAALKRQLTAQTIGFAQQQYKELNEALRRNNGHGNDRLEHLTPVFLKDVGNRIDLLWKKDTLTLGEFHRYFDELLVAYGTGATLYHKLTMEQRMMPLPAVFPLLQIFSLYLFVCLNENGTGVFSLDSEAKSSGGLLLRIYNLTHEAGHGKASSYHLLKETISRQRHPDVTMDVIENLEFGNMVVAEINLHNQN
ncbi:MAG TPA: hypothetical protein VM871_12400, partial [Flavisolibacter sp.]|nr:hypothetical protein [Flavisolibacter sp.]